MILKPNFIRRLLIAMLTITEPCNDNMVTSTTVEWPLIIIGRD